ncbi:MAG: hypothetical protein ACK5MK_07230 [Dysgonomonas sp.]
MDNFDDILNQLRDSSGDLKANMHMLNEIVPVEEQIKYFQYSKRIQSDKTKDVFDKHFLIARLFTPEVDVEDKRYYLTCLAGLIDIAAYRAIETYHKSPLESELANWSALALVESRILLDSELSGEKQFFVSTGLGGRDGKLRFFSVLASKDRMDFTEFQSEMILRELQFSFECNKIEMEKIEVKNNYVKMFILCDLNHNARKAIENVVKECNELGEFLDTKFIITNIKYIEDHEIENLLNKQNSNDTDSPVI